MTKKCSILHLLVRVTIDSGLKKLLIEDWNISITKLLVHFRSYSYLAIFCRCLLAWSILIIPTNHMLFVVDGISQTSYRLMNIAHQILWMNRVSLLIEHLDFEMLFQTHAEAPQETKNQNSRIGSITNSQETNSNSLHKAKTWNETT